MVHGMYMPIVHVIQEQLQDTVHQCIIRLVSRQDVDLREKPLKNEDIPSYSEFAPEFTTLLRQMRAKL